MTTEPVTAQPGVAAGAGPVIVEAKGVTKTSCSSTTRKAASWCWVPTG
jgi:hypothetical protein